MSSIPLPALDVKPPQQQPSILDQFSHVMALKNLMQGQQLQQQQIQGAQLENQQRQMDLNSQQALQKAYMEANGDPDKTTQLAAKYGAKPQALLQWQTSVLDQKAKTLDLVAKQGDLAKRDADLVQGAHDTVAAAKPEDRPAVYQEQLAALGQQLSNPAAIQKMPPQYPGDEAFRMIGATVRTHTQMVDDAVKQSEQFKNTQQGNEAAGNVAKLAAEQQWYASHPGVGAPGVPPETAQMADSGVKPSQYPAWKAAQEAAATQPYKIEQAAAEGKARQLIQGMTEPVYAYVPQPGGAPQKTLMSKTDALQAGIKTMLPVTEKEVSDDTMLINRLGDVRQKIARYEQSLQQPVSSSDKTNMAALLDSQKLRLGAFGTEFPTNRFNSMLQGENLKGLSSAARDQLVAYRNVREAIVGYQRVLSGSGKSSDTALELNEQTMPDPSITDKDFANRSIGQFKENLNIVGQGLPNIPGVKNPEEWERQVTKPGEPRSVLRFPQTSVSSLADLLGAGK